jgi:signal transduction histidine kinase
MRVVQEALVNVYRHSGARGVWVSLTSDAGQLRLRIRDDGKGMARVEADGAMPRLGVGIPGMEARIRQFGGSLSVSSSRKGTTIVADIRIENVGAAASAA